MLQTTHYSQLLRNKKIVLYFMIDELSTIKEALFEQTTLNTLHTQRYLLNFFIVCPS